MKFASHFSIYILSIESRVPFSINFTIDENSRPIFYLLSIKTRVRFSIYCRWKLTSAFLFTVDENSRPIFLFTVTVDKIVSPTYLLWNKRRKFASQISIYCRWNLPSYFSIYCRWKSYVLSIYCRWKLMSDFLFTANEISRPVFYLQLSMKIGVRFSIYCRWKLASHFSIYCW